MFNTEISIFRTFDSDPKIITLGRWIRVCMNSDNKFAKQVKRYRQTGDVDLKKGLPLATVGAVCEGGRKRSDVKEQTGWIALDIDAHDNPHLDDAEAVRNAVGQLPFIAFAGLSVSGRGVWALVKVKQPNKQAKHFEQLKKDFEYYGITLDSTKGKNPNDARFYSFDPDAYVADSFEIYDRLSKEKPKPTRPTVNRSQIENTDKYAEVALNDELETLSRTANGNRNNQLFKSSAALAQLVAGGVLNKNEVADALYSTAKSIGLPNYEIKTTINSGFRAGMRNPRQPSKNGQPKPLSRKDSASNSGYKTKDFKKFSDSLNEINPPEKGTQEHAEATRHMINDADEDELQELCKKDPTVAKMIELFNCEVQPPTDLIYKEPGKQCLSCSMGTN